MQLALYAVDTLPARTPAMSWKICRSDHNVEPSIRGTLLGFPIIRIIYDSIFGSTLGSPDFGKLP